MLQSKGRSAKEDMMFQVIYEYTKPWPAEGALHVDVQLTGDISISPEHVRRRVNGYLSREVALFAVADKPALVLGDHALWRVPVQLELRGLGAVGVIGSIDVDAVTGEVIPLTARQIQTMQERARNVAQHSPSAAKSAS